MIHISNGLLQTSKIRIQIIQDLQFSKIYQKSKSIHGVNVKQIGMTQRLWRKDQEENLCCHLVIHLIIEIQMMLCHIQVNSIHHQDMIQDTHRDQLLQDHHSIHLSISILNTRTKPIKVIILLGKTTAITVQLLVRFLLTILTSTKQIHVFNNKIQWVDPDHHTISLSSDKDMSLCRTHRFRTWWDFCKPKRIKWLLIKLKWNSSCKLLWIRWLTFKKLIEEVVQANRLTLEFNQMMKWDKFQMYFVTCSAWLAHRKEMKESLDSPKISRDKFSQDTLINYSTIMSLTQVLKRSIY